MRTIKVLLKCPISNGQWEKMKQSFADIARCGFTIEVEGDTWQETIEPLTSLTEENFMRDYKKIREELQDQLHSLYKTYHPKPHKRLLSNLEMVEMHMGSAVRLIEESRKIISEMEGEI